MRFKNYFLFCVPLLTIFMLFACDSAEKSRPPQKETKLTAEERLEGIKGDLKLVKAELANEGEYNCCIQPTCNWCALNEGDCECYDNLKDGGKVCPGCGLGWHNGKGVAEGFQANEIKWDIAHEHHEHEGEHAH